MLFIKNRHLLFTAISDHISIFTLFLIKQHASLRKRNNYDKTDKLKDTTMIP